MAVGAAVAGDGPAPRVRAAAPDAGGPQWVATGGLPVLRIEDLAAGEGQRGRGAYGFIVRMSEKSAESVQVRYVTLSGTARAGIDFVETAGTLTFMPGQTSKKIPVLFKGDTEHEPNETFVVRLFDASGARVDDEVGLGTILNDDGPVLKINHVAQVEGDSGLSHFEFTVGLSEKHARTVSVRFATVNGSAHAGSDFAANRGLLLFPPGYTSQTIRIAVRGDKSKEPNETFAVLLSAASGATIYTNRGIGTIRNDDGH